MTKTITKSTVEINEQELRIFPDLGVELSDTPNSAGQYVGDCPFCDKENHFYVSLDGEFSGSKQGDGGMGYKCLSCNSSGNKYTFLRKLYELYAPTTSNHALNRLSLKRKKFPMEAFKDAKVAYNLVTQQWMLPCHTVSGGVTNIYRYTGNEGAPLYSLPACSTHLYGLETLKPEGPIFLCEGQWDAISLRYLLKQCNTIGEAYSVLSVPGASNLPPADLKHLMARDIFLLYDNDKPGHDGQISAVKKLTGQAKSIHVLQWPPNRFAEGYDITDLVRESKLRPEQTWEELRSWCFEVEAGSVPDSTPKIPELKRDTIQEVINDFKETGVHVYPGFKDALIIALAVIESIRFKGEPLWLYLIGVSGAGKSLILEATLASPNCLYRTAITHRSFVSGFKAEEGVDPSLLAHLPGKALVVKDYSNVLALPAYEQDQLFSLLREAYDGKVIRGYGNHVLRQYPPVGSPHEDCRFSFVAGVTPDIYTRDNSALGERFLRYHIPRTLGDDLRAIETAMDDSWKTHQRALHRAASVSGFLNRESAKFSSREDAPQPTIPEWFRKRLICLAQFVGYCRSHVSRTKDDLDYDPAVESGTRMAKQLRKLAMSIARVTGKTQCDAEVYRLTRKVAWDTCHGKRRNIFKHIYEQGQAECSELAKLTGYSNPTVHRQLRDMHALGILKRGKSKGSTGGRPQQVYLLTERAKEIFEGAKITELVR